MTETSAQPELSIGAPVIVALLSVLLVAGLWGAANSEPETVADDGGQAAGAVSPATGRWTIPVSVRVEIGADATLDLLGDGVAPVPAGAEAELTFLAERDRPWLMVLEDAGRVVGLSLLPGGELEGLDQVVVSADTTAAALVALAPPVLVGDAAEHAERIVAAWSNPQFAAVELGIAGEVASGGGFLTDAATISAVGEVARGAELVAGPGRPVRCPGDSACPALSADRLSVAHGLGAWVATLDKASSAVCGWLPPARSTLVADEIRPAVIEIASVAEQGEVDSDRAMDAAVSALADEEESQDQRQLSGIAQDCELVMATPNGSEVGELRAEVIRVARGATVVSEVIEPLSEILGLTAPPVAQAPVEMATWLPTDLLDRLAEDQGATLGPIFDLAGVLPPLPSSVVAPIDDGVIVSEAGMYLSCATCSVGPGADTGVPGVVEILRRFGAADTDFIVGPTVSWEPR